MEMEKYNVQCCANHIVGVLCSANMLKVIKCKQSPDCPVCVCKNHICGSVLCGGVMIERPYRLREEAPPQSLCVGLQGAESLS